MSRAQDYERRIIARACENGLDADNVVSVALDTEMERVRPALETSIAFFEGFTDNPYAVEALRLCRRALKRGEPVSREKRVDIDKMITKMEAALEKRERRRR